MRKTNDEFDPDKLPEFKIPASFLKKLESFSFGGDYMLFVRNSKGNVVPIINCNDSVVYSGVMSFLASFALASLQNQSESVADSVFNPDDNWQEED